MTTRSMFVIFDLDGTLALNEHRQHFVQREVGKKDWRSFFAACDSAGGQTANMSCARHWPILN